MLGALLGDADQGHWTLRPADPDATVSRHYLPGTLILVTTWQTGTGTVEVQDFMPIDGDSTHVIRRVRGVRGTVAMQTQLRLRFDYARTVPWVRQTGDESQPALSAVGGPDAIVVRGVQLRADDHAHSARFDIAAGHTRDLVLTWFPSHLPTPAAPVVGELADETIAWWRDWSGTVSPDGPFGAQSAQSLLVLRALSNRDTGGIVAAATTSLPEELGGVRNWDYRFVWLRDSALTLSALVRHGHLGIAEHWRQWLLRAIAGDPSDVQIMYGIAGERDLPERELRSLPGYEGAAPVRIGNGAVDQLQLDIYGEVLVALDDAREAGLEESELSWALQRSLIEHVVSLVHERDQGLWEVRGEPQRFTHSRVMLWAALDRGVRGVREHGRDGDAERWAQLRDQLRAEIETAAVSPAGHFTQYEGTDEVDAALLMLPMVGFCAPDDPRMLATVARMESDLMHDGLLLRYRTTTGVDGVPGNDSAFLACSFWLVEQYARCGRRDDAQVLMHRLCSLMNDVGLLSEEYDVQARRLTGNMPQAFSHLALVRAADSLRDPNEQAAA